jgi:hypothetical protein
MSTAQHEERTHELLDDLGFDGVDAGSLDESWRQQPGTPVYCTDLSREGARRALAKADRAKSPEIRSFAPHLIAQRAAISFGSRRVARSSLRSRWSEDYVRGPCREGKRSHEERTHLAQDAAAHGGRGEDLRTEPGERRGGLQREADAEEPTHERHDREGVDARPLERARDLAPAHGPRPSYRMRERLHDRANEREVLARGADELDGPAACRCDQAPARRRQRDGASTPDWRERGRDPPQLGP